MSTLIILGCIAVSLFLAWFPWNRPLLKKTVRRLGWPPLVALMFAALCFAGAIVVAVVGVR